MQTVQLPFFLAATPFLEAGAAAAGGVSLGAKGVDYIESLFS